MSSSWHIQTRKSRAGSQPCWKQRPKGTSVSVECSPWTNNCPTSARCWLNWSIYRNKVGPSTDQWMCTVYKCFIKMSLIYIYGWTGSQLMREDIVYVRCSFIGWNLAQRYRLLTLLSHSDTIGINWCQIWIPISNRTMPWWRHQMTTFSALLAICAGNSPVPGDFPTQRPVTRICDVFFDLRLNKRLSKQSWGWWFETLSRPLWRQCNANTKDAWCVSVQVDCHSMAFVFVL